MRVHDRNPRVTSLLLAVTAIEVLVLFASGGGLFFLPTVLPEIWPWALTPFNTTFLGAVYLAALVAAAMLVLVGRWSPARVVVPMILLFTTIILLVSLAYLERFEPGLPFTWLWFVLYIGIPINAAYHLWLYRSLPPAGDRRLSAPMRAILAAEAAVLGFYGLGLLLAPGWFSAFWPWPVDGFHARLYSATFVTPALGAFLLLRAATWDEAMTLGLTQVVLGLLSILGLALVDASVQRVDWSAPGTWLWIGGFALVFAVGAGLIWAAGSLPRLTTRLAAAGFAIPIRYVALLIGVAFTAAGVAGFLPTFTTPPPAGAPALALHHSYGYLLGLFPINLLHNLFHLGIGLLGLFAAARVTTARTYVRGFAVILAALTVMGMLPGLRSTFGLVPLFGHDVWLHGVEALAAGYAGFVMPDQVETTARRLARAA